MFKIRQVFKSIAAGLIGLGQRNAESLLMAGDTHVGMRRGSNQDAYWIGGTHTLPRWCRASAIVLDGVGGLPHGEEASARAAEYYSEILRSRYYKDLVRPEPTILTELFNVLHTKLLIDGETEPNLRGMATTATSALFIKSKPIVWITSIGDSPAYRLRDGCLEKLVEEDSLVADLVRQGVLTPEEAKQHPRRNVITQALGLGDQVIARIAVTDVQRGDVFLLCTDGLTNAASEEQIAEILVGESPEEACRSLISVANAQGGPDNVTAVVIKDGS